MTTTRHRANPLMLLPGVLFIIVGLVLMIGGLVWGFAAMTSLGDRVPQISDLGTRPDVRGLAGPTTDAFDVCMIGTTVMTIGRYMRRGARRRGWRDRLGRLFLIITCLGLGAGVVLLTRSLLAAMNEEDG